MRESGIVAVISNPMMEEKKLIMGTMIRATMLGRGIRIGPPPPSPGNKSSFGHDICQTHYVPAVLCEKLRHKCIRHCSCCQTESHEEEMKLRTGMTSWAGR